MALLTRSRAVPIVVAALVPVAACRDPAGPAPLLSYHRAVYAVLEVESPLVRVLAEELFAEGGRGALRGAQGTVTGTSGSVALTEADTSLARCFLVTTSRSFLREDGCYAAQLPEPVGASESVILAMTLPDGTAVQGALVAPGLPSAFIPPDSQRVTWPDVGPLHPEDRLPLVIVPVVLEAAPGARRVDVVATVARGFTIDGRSQDVEPSDCQVDGSTAPFKESLTGRHDLYLYRLTCFGGSVTGLDSLDLAVHVIAMEENYAGYMNDVLGSSSIDIARSGFGVEGAVGVFGAVATTLLPLRLIFEHR